MFFPLVIWGWMAVYLLLLLLLVFAQPPAPLLFFVMLGTLVGLDLLYSSVY